MKSNNIVSGFRYEGGHAAKHFLASNHTYALQIGSNRVWDYAGKHNTIKFIAITKNTYIKIGTTMQSLLLQLANSSNNILSNLCPRYVDYILFCRMFNLHLITAVISYLILSLR